MSHCANPVMRRMLINVLVSMVLLTTQASAQETGSALGRLFLTPEHRQALDRQRQQHILEERDMPAATELTINGVVTRSSGKRTAWINGRAQNEHELRNEQVLIPNRKEPGKVIIKSSESPPLQAKVGETVNRETGESSTPLGEGQIRIKSGSNR